MEEKVTCAQRLKEALNLRNMKQVDLCGKTGIGKSAMSQYVNGNVEPKQDRIELIAKALNVTEAWLMGYDVPIMHISNDAKDCSSSEYDYLRQLENINKSMLLNKQLKYKKELAEKDSKLLNEINNRPLLREFVENLIAMDDDSIKAFATIAGLKSPSANK